jgi:hypothetical protein
MLSRVLPAAVCGLLIFASCKRSIESKLVGSWRGHTDEMAGQIWFSANHTFVSHDWDATNSLTDTGDWHVSGDKIVLNFRGATSTPEAKHIEVPFTLLGNDTLVVRATNGRVNTFERQK